MWLKNSCHINICIYIFYMNAFTSSWQPNELIFYGRFCCYRAQFVYQMETEAAFLPFL